MSLPFPTPRAAGAASNQSAAAQQSRAAAVAKLTHSINTADAPAEINPFGALLSPLLATAGITTWPLLRLYAVFYVWFLFYCATEIGCGHQQLSHGVPACSHSSHSLYSCARCLCLTDLDRCGSELTCTSVCCVLCAVCCVLCDTWQVLRLGIALCDPGRACIGGGCGTVNDRVLRYLHSHAGTGRAALRCAQLAEHSLVLDGRQHVLPAPHAAAAFPSERRLSPCSGSGRRCLVHSRGRSGQRCSRCFPRSTDWSSARRRRRWCS